MTPTLTCPCFDDASIAARLDGLDATELDELPFGVIGFDAHERVDLYNRHESEAAGLGKARVVGRALFTEVAPCMNNVMVAQRFREARAAGTALDVTIDYVLTLRMRPTPVAMRLVTHADRAYVLIRRLAPS